MSLDRDGRYYASFNYEIDTKEIQNTNNLLGLDLGIKDYITTSEGDKINGDDIIDNYSIREQQLESRKRRYDKIHSRRKENSNRKEKARIMLARAISKLNRLKYDMIHKLTSGLVINNDGFATEDLYIEGLKKNKKLAPSIHKVGWGELKRQTKYKSELNGKPFIVIDRWFPSSKTCSDCGTINKELKLNDREWTCNECGVIHDRDVNAAINIRERGQRGSLSSINIARGEDVRLGKHYVTQAALMKREVLDEKSY